MWSLCGLSPPGRCLWRRSEDIARLNQSFGIGESAVSCGTLCKPEYPSHKHGCPDSVCAHRRNIEPIRKKEGCGESQCTAVEEGDQQASDRYANPVRSDSEAISVEAKRNVFFQYQRELFGVSCLTDEPYRRCSIMLIGSHRILAFA